MTIKYLINFTLNQSHMPLLNTNCLIINKNKNWLIDHWPTPSHPFSMTSAFIGPVNWARQTGQFFLFIIHFEMHFLWKK